MTQKQMMEALLNKVADQAAEIALLKRSKELAEKRADTWEQRALKAEQERDAVARSHAHLIDERDKVISQFDFAKQNLKEAYTLIEDVWENTTTGGNFQPPELAAYGRWWQTYRDFYLKPEQPKAPLFVGTAAANGTGGAHGE